MDRLRFLIAPSSFRPPFVLPRSVYAPTWMAKCNHRAHIAANIEACKEACVTSHAQTRPPPSRIIEQVRATLA
eukprot:5655723-Pleurochrysis_carterae.AAC.1